MHVEGQGKNMTCFLFERGRVKWNGTDSCVGFWDSFKGTKLLISANDTLNHPIGTCRHLNMIFCSVHTLADFKYHGHPSIDTYL